MPLGWLPRGLPQSVITAHNEAIKMLPEKLTRRQLLFGLSTLPMSMVSKINQVKVRETVCNPKFNIGDYVECHFDRLEDPTYYQRGEVTGITLQQDGTWDYTLLIRECTDSCFVGASDIAYETELVLLARANSKTELFGF